jgi:hypothetical protein
MNTLPYHLQIRTLDLDQVRRYLHGIESLAREAAKSDDPRVVMTALTVLARQQQTVAELGVRP